MSTPVPSTRDEAVEWARETRHARDSVLSSVVAGDLDLSAAVSAAASNPATSGLRVVSLLESVPGLGKMAARRVLRSLDIDTHRPVGDLDAEDVLALTEFRG